MKIVQDINVDGETIIVNEDNKLQVVGSAPDVSELFDEKAIVVELFKTNIQTDTNNFSYSRYKNVNEFTLTDLIYRHVKGTNYKVNTGFRKTGLWFNDSPSKDVPYYDATLDEIPELKNDIKLILGVSLINRNTIRYYMIGGSLVERSYFNLEPNTYLITTELLIDGVEIPLFILESEVTHSIERFDDNWINVVKIDINIDDKFEEIVSEAFNNPNNHSIYLTSTHINKKLPIKPILSKYTKKFGTILGVDLRKDGSDKTSRDMLSELELGYTPKPMKYSLLIEDDHSKYFHVENRVFVYGTDTYVEYIKFTVIGDTTELLEQPIILNAYIGRNSYSLFWHTENFSKYITGLTDYPSYSDNQQLLSLINDTITKNSEKLYIKGTMFLNNKTEIPIDLVLNPKQLIKEKYTYNYANYEENLPQLNSFYPLIQITADTLEEFKAKLVKDYTITEES